MNTTGRFCLLACLTGLLSACASVPNDAGSTASDPWERLNRQTFIINSAADEYVIRPVAKGYIKVVPAAARNRVSDFFTNLGEPSNAINNGLQGKGRDAMTSVFRFLINTSFGLGGLFDVAGSVGKQPVKNEDFGQTLAVWGVPNGPYFVIPLLGPSTVRDAGGRAVGVAVQPMTYAQEPVVEWSAWSMSLLDQRATVMPATDLLRSAVDPYVMAREGYLASRRSQVYDGNPPMELLQDEFEEDDENEAMKQKGVEK